MNNLDTRSVIISLLSLVLIIDKDAHTVGPVSGPHVLSASWTSHAVSCRREPASTLQPSHRKTPPTYLPCARAVFALSYSTVSLAPIGNIVLSIS